MSASTQKSIIKGTLILTIAGILSRFLGFYNRIFLTNLFGARELGIYQMIFPVYMVIFSFCCQGIQTALTRQIARPNHNISAGFCLLKHARPDFSFSFHTMQLCYFLSCKAYLLSAFTRHRMYTMFKDPVTGFSFCFFEGMSFRLFYRHSEVN